MLMNICIGHHHRVCYVAIGAAVKQIHSDMQRLSALCYWVQAVNKF